MARPEAARAQTGTIPEVADQSWWNTRTPDQRRSFVNAVVRQRGDLSPYYSRATGTAPSWYAESMAQAWNDSHALVSRNRVNAPAINRSMQRTMFKGKLWYSLTEAVKSGKIAKLALRGGAAGIGVSLLAEYGTGLAKKLFKIGGDATVATPSVLLGVDWGRIPDASGRCVFYAVSGPTTSMGTTNGSNCLADPARQFNPIVPGGALYAKIYYRNPSGVDKTTWASTCLTGPIPAPPEGFLVQGIQEYSCAAEGGWDYHDLKAYGLSVLPYDDPLNMVPIDPPSSTYPAGTNGSQTLEEGRHVIPNPPAPSLAELEAGIEESIESAQANALRKQLEWFWAHMPAEDDPMFATGEQAPVLNPISPNGSPADGITTLTMPGCRSLTVADCEQRLHDAGWTAANVQVTQLDFATADPEIGPERVTESDPAPGQELDSNQAVFVTINPDAENMPVAIPAPLPHETYPQYMERLQNAGLVGSVQFLSDSTLDPTEGPNVVIRTDPQAGTRVAPGTGVEVFANPSTAPPVDGSGGGGTPGTGTGDGGGDGVGGGGVCTPFDVRAFNFDPLTSLSDSDSFPFGIVSWVGDLLDQLDVGAVAPNFSFDFPGVDEPLEVDLSRYTGFITGTIHPLISWVALISLVLAAVSVCFPLFSFANRDPGSQLPEDPEHEAVRDSEFRGVKGWGA
jgi:hypothetical protein